jgi:DNA-binding NarL/FixJ family response regulator
MIASEFEAVREMMASGWSIKKIARALKIAPRTIALQLGL